ncbi:hypothetical protein FQN54_007870 [Arachnomyces sp. PD_36]|nr:hypothetical protein FQN54_007870 [Arachnomyces sp. PD_36]
MAIPSHPKIEGLDVIQAIYKQIGDHGIRTDILVPQTPFNGKRPVIILFHGGGLVAGDSLLMDWWSNWVPDIARQHGAVIVSPNYRLMPEATSTEIYDDVDDFWNWFHSPALKNLLAAHTAPTELDYSRLLVTGPSAGGLLGIYLALAHPAEIRAAAVAYPWVDPVSPFFTAPPENPPVGQHFPESIIDDILASAAPGTPVSSDATPNRIAFMLAAVEHGRLAGFYKRDSEGTPRGRLYPMEKIEEPDLEIPRGGIAVIQGRQDSIVPLCDVERFVTRLREVTKNSPGGEKVMFTVRDGGHGFDGDTHYEEKWLQHTLKMAVETWLE